MARLLGTFLENFKPLLEFFVDGCPEEVGKPINQDLKTWDIYKVENLFALHVAREIFKIKIPLEEEQDMLMWSPSCQEDLTSNRHTNWTTLGDLKLAH